MNNLKHLNTAEKHNNGNLLKKTGIFLFWLILWQILSSSINNSIIFVGPADVHWRHKLPRRNSGKPSACLHSASSLDF